MGWNLGPIGNRALTALAAPVNTITAIAQGKNARQIASDAVKDTTGVSDFQKDLELINDPNKLGISQDAPAPEPGKKPGMKSLQDAWGTAAQWMAAGGEPNGWNRGQKANGVFQPDLGKNINGVGGYDFGAGKTGGGGGGGVGPGGGTESGGGPLQKWFADRAAGTDPAWEYSTGRAASELDARAARAGGYDSSGAAQNVSDMYANAISQRMGQLDNLAAGASGERSHTLDSIFKYGGDIASGLAGTARDYDMAAAKTEMDAKIRQIQLKINRGEIDPAVGQQQINDLQAGLAAAAKAAGNQAGKPPVKGPSGPTEGSQPLEYPTLENPQYTPLK